MQITVHFRKTKPSEALREYAAKRLSKVEKLLVKPEDGSVTLEVNKQDHIAHVSLRANGEVFDGKHVAEDMYAAIDQVVDKIERQARRYKEKLFSHR